MADHEFHPDCPTCREEHLKLHPVTPVPASHFIITFCIIATPVVVISILTAAGAWGSS